MRSIEKKKFVNSENMGNYVNVDGFRIHYYEEGEGFPMLLLHGRGQSMYCWHNNVDGFSENYRVILVDLIGCGYSEKPDLEYSIRDYGEFIRAFLDALGIDRTHIGAFGEGAIYALDFLIRYPERVDKSLLVSPGGKTRYSSLWDKLMSVRYIGEICTLLINLSSVRKRLLEAFFDETYVTEEMVEQVYKPLNNKEAKMALLTSIRSWDDSFISQNAKNIKKPMFVVWGQNDKWHPSQWAEHFTRQIPGAEMAALRNCGYLVQEEKFREFNDMALSFFLGQDNKEKFVI